MALGFGWTTEHILKFVQNKMGGQRRKEACILLYHYEDRHRVYLEILLVTHTAKLS